MADRTLAAKSSSPRDVNLWNRDAVSTGAGAVDSMAARMVQRPSPESETRPEKRSSVGCSRREMAVRSRSHDATAGRQRFENRIQLLYHVGFAADHLAIAALKAPDTAARSHIAIVDAFGREFLSATDVVDVIRIASID